jgi:hypothetical protein
MSGQGRFESINEIACQMPTIGNLNCVGSAFRDTRRISLGAITGDDFYGRMCLEPLG